MKTFFLLLLTAGVACAEVISEHRPDTPEIIAERAAMASNEAAQAVAPVWFAKPIEAPLIIFTNGIGLVASTNGPVVVPFVAHESPYDPAKAASNATAALAANADVRAQLRAIKVSMAATIDGLQTNVDRTVFTGAQRTEFQDLLNLVTDLAKECKDLRRQVLRMNNEDDGL